MHVYEHSYMVGRGGQVGLKLFAAIEGYTIACVIGLTLPRHGVVIRPAGLEGPEQIGRVERRGAMLEKDECRKSSRTRTLQAENRWT